MMKTPICDFVEQYVGQNKLRLHMPGHKGKEQLGKALFTNDSSSFIRSRYAFETCEQI